MTPFHSSEKCITAGCVSDLNKMCPAGMAVRDGAAGNRYRFFRIYIHKILFSEGLKGWLGKTMSFFIAKMFSTY
jgi:hypothetical protein